MITSQQVGKETRRELAEKIHEWAQDILKVNETCGLGVNPWGRYVVIWPGLINHWVNRPEEKGTYLGTLSRTSTIQDIERLLPRGDEP